MSKQLVFPFYAPYGLVDLSRGIKAVGQVLSLDTLFVIRDKVAMQGADRKLISEIDAEIERKII